MKILELYAGSRSIGREADQHGHRVFSVDVEPFDDIDLVEDIEFIDFKQIPFKPDMIWASPPCTSYSIAAISTHRNGVEPKSFFARKSDRLIKRTLEIIDYYKCVYYIENPVGMLRKMPIMKDRPRATVTYCSYGDIRMKPTDIWSNNIYGLFNPNGWHPRHKCWNNNPKCPHERAPRGSKTGTQGVKGDFKRSMIPSDLCKDIIISTQKRL